MRACVNTATGVKYPFNQGSVEERALFRVMPVDSNRTKMYFDSQEEYLAWRGKQLATDTAIAALQPHVIPGTVSN